MKKQNGKGNLVGVVFVAVLVVFVGLLLTQIFTFPSYEDEKAYSDLAYLASLEGLTVDEYADREAKRLSEQRNEAAVREAIIDAIHLKQNDQLPELLAQVIETLGDDYDRWPYLYSEAIKADNMGAFSWLIKQKVNCDYNKIHALGGMAFYMAVEKRKLEYFDLLLKKNCSITHNERQDPIHEKVRRLRDKEWLDLLHGYYPEIGM